MGVAGRVLEKRPGHMSALRARALIAETLATTEGIDLHTRKALALAEQGARDWEAILKLDPSNQIAWNNLVNARLGAGFCSLSLGNLREAQEQWHAALDVERNVKEAAFSRVVLSLAAGCHAAEPTWATGRRRRLPRLNRRLIDCRHP
jgi:hypothetical protein